MVMTLLASLAAFTALFGWLLMLRLQQLRTRSRLTAIRLDIALIKAAGGHSTDRCVKFARARTSPGTALKADFAVPDEESKPAFRAPLLHLS